MKMFYEQIGLIKNHPGNTVKGSKAQIMSFHLLVIHLLNFRQAVTKNVCEKAYEGKASRNKCADQVLQHL